MQACKRDTSGTITSHHVNDDVPARLMVRWIV